MKVSDLKPHPKNAEIYGDNESISDLLEKIKRSGQVHTLVATSNGVVLAGHRRLKACNELGIKEVDVEIRDFDTPEQEIEYIIDNNATREKTNEQKAREAIVLKHTLSELAKKRKMNNLKQNQITEVSKMALREDATQVKGKTRDIIAEKVGFKSGAETDRAIKTIKKIDELKQEGRADDAEFVRDVMNNRSVSAGQNIAENIDNIKISEEQKAEIRAGRKSPNSFIKKNNKKEFEPQKAEMKSIKTDVNVKDLEGSLTVIQKRFQDYLLLFQPIYILLK